MGFLTSIKLINVDIRNIFVVNNLSEVTGIPNDLFWQAAV